jgi:uncharacterized protein Yka (UPF0111/DUF47 family)
MSNETLESMRAKVGMAISVLEKELYKNWPDIEQMGADVSDICHAIDNLERHMMQIKAEPIPEAAP